MQSCCTVVLICTEPYQPLKTFSHEEEYFSKGQTGLELWTWCIRCQKGWEDLFYPWHFKGSFPFVTAVIFLAFDPNHNHNIILTWVVRAKTSANKTLRTRVMCSKTQLCLHLLCSITTYMFTWFPDTYNMWIIEFYIWYNQILGGGEYNTGKKNMANFWANICIFTHSARTDQHHSIFTENSCLLWLKTMLMRAEREKQNREFVGWKNQKRETERHYKTQKR